MSRNFAIQVKPSQNEGQKLLPANFHCMLLCAIGFVRINLYHPLSSIQSIGLLELFYHVLTTFKTFQNLRNYADKLADYARKVIQARRVPEWEKEPNMAMEKRHHLQKNRRFDRSMCHFFLRSLEVKWL